MTNQVSILYTYRNPWPRRLALAAVVLLLLGAAKFTSARINADSRLQGCSSTAAH